MNIHFIAIGGAAMHNLAIALKNNGHNVSGSDDEIVEPSSSRLKKNGLLPDKNGWFPEKISTSLDAIVLGMHARLDNPELVRAQELKVPVYSYPEYLYEHAKKKKRIVIGGSHGKTTITAMIMHVLKDNNLNFDYMVGSQLEGFETMVRLTLDAPIIVLEGDEYLASPIDRRPKFHLYHPEVALLSGIAWDHINVFPTFEMYKEQFTIFINTISKGGTLVWSGLDPILKEVVEGAGIDINKREYKIPKHRISNGVSILQHNNGGETPLKIFGDHNLLNLEGARFICNNIGVPDEKFYVSISNFKGAARRLELVDSGVQTAIYKDFAHSPSKLKATTEAVRKQFPDRKLIAVMELHTFSSLNEDFLKEYKDSMSLAHEAIVYFNPHTIEHKKLKPISNSQVIEAFGGNNVKVITDTKELLGVLNAMNWASKNLLLMSSGTFDGLNYKALAEQVLNKPN